ACRCLGLADRDCGDRADEHCRRTAAGAACAPPEDRRRIGRTLEAHHSMLGQAIAITGINIKSIPQRWGSSLVIVIGLAGVVGVFTALLAMAAGFESTLKATGRNDAVIVMRGGSETELNSALDRDTTELIKQGPGIRAGTDGKPLASAEMMVIAELIRRDDVKNGANITLRSVQPAA